MKYLVFIVCLVLGIATYEFFLPVSQLVFMTPDDSSELHLLQGNPGDGLTIYVRK